MYTSSLSGLLLLAAHALALPTSEVDRSTDVSGSPPFVNADDAALSITARAAVPLITPTASPTVSFPQPVPAVTDSPLSGSIHNAMVSTAADSLPFNKMVAFGDDFTDDSSGSFAHGITGTNTGANKQLWGYGTWTDGQVAATYVSRTLGIPMSYNFAWGSSGGAEKIGSVCSNALLDQSKTDGHAMYNGALVPDALGQIANYSTSPYNTDISNTLHFLWTGNNDVIASLGWLGRFTICIDGLCLGTQTPFINKVANCQLQTMKRLIALGAKHIVVPNIYPRHLAPWTTIWIVQNLGYIANFGSVIDKLNARLQANVQALNTQYAAQGVNIMYYDVNSYIKETVSSPTTAGVTPGYTNTCVDGCVIQNPTKVSNWNMWWRNTVIGKKADNFYWMTSVMPSGTVCRSIGLQIAAFVRTQVS